MITETIEKQESGVAPRLLLGQAPTKEQLEKGLIERFIYEYEFFLKSVLHVDFKNESIYDELNRAVKSIPNFNDLDDESKWWALYLIVVHLYTNDIERAYLKEHIRAILINKGIASYEQVSQQVFLILRGAGLEAPIARPVAIMDRNSEVVEAAPFVKHLFACIEDGAKFFKANVRLKDLKDEFYYSSCLVDEQYIKPFTTKWTILSELFARHLLTVAARGFNKPLEAHSEEDMLNVIFESSVGFFMTATTYDAEKCEALAVKALTKFKILE